MSSNTQTPKKAVMLHYDIDCKECHNNVNIIKDRIEKAKDYGQEFFVQMKHYESVHDPKRPILYVETFKLPEKQ